MSRQRHRKTVGLVFACICVILALAIGFVAGKFWPEKVEEPDPHEGQVFLNDGLDDVWIFPWENTEVNTLCREDFQTLDDVEYIGEGFEVRKGIDVSDFQGEIDWDTVKNAGYDFVFVRAGFRGYGKKGSLNADDRCMENISGAKDAGLDVGAYFYSQAITVEEAIEEAQFVLDILDGEKLTLPVIFDWEANNASDSRTCNINKVFLSEAGVQFCKTIEEGGYEAGIYFYRQLGYYVYDLEDFQDYTLWLAEPGNYPGFYYAVDFWQYNVEATVPGIDIICDVNYQFTKKDA